MTIQILIGDVRERLKDLADESVHCVVTSPPYFGLRDYGMPGQIGLEPTPAEFVEAMVQVFREVRRVLRPDGTLWLNLGDSYAGSWGAQGRTGQMSDRSVIHARQIAAHPRKQTRTGSIPEGSGLKPKDLMGIPWRVAFALQEDGWWLRSSIIWHKPNPMPESITDRPTSAHENIFLLAKSERYFYDHEAVKEPLAPASAARYAYEFGGSKNEQLKASDKPTAVVGKRDATDGRNLRNVWTVNTEPFREAHFATFPPALIDPCIKAGCPQGGTVLDPFGGAGTTGLVADRLGRNAVLIELNPEYAAMARRRIEGDGGMFTSVNLDCSLKQVMSN